MHFLLFTLYAPMGSFGEVAVGERRMSRARPGRSAVLGLVAAAQGIERSDEAAHRELEDGLHYAVRTDGPGRPVVDYHTAQTPKARRGRTFATRREELSSDALHTVLSVREWRTDAFFTVVAWPRAGRTVDLDAIAECLRRPGFALYVGRKSESSPPRTARRDPCDISPVCVSSVKLPSMRSRRFCSAPPVEVDHPGSRAIISSGLSSPTAPGAGAIFFGAR